MRFTTRDFVVFFATPVFRLHSLFNLFAYFCICFPSCSLSEPFRCWEPVRLSISMLKQLLIALICTGNQNGLENQCPAACLVGHLCKCFEQPTDSVLELQRQQPCNYNEPADGRWCVSIVFSLCFCFWLSFLLRLTLFLCFSVFSKAVFTGSILPMILINIMSPPPSTLRCRCRCGTTSRASTRGARSVGHSVAVYC